MSPKDSDTDTVHDLGIEGVDFHVDVSDEFTGKAGTCVRVRGWTRYKNGEYGPTRNGIHVPVEYAPELAQVILDAFNTFNGQNLVIVDAANIEGGSS